jgi:hypothetical protein
MSIKPGPGTTRKREYSSEKLRLTLPYNASVPSRKVMDIDHTIRACLEASLHK